MKSQGLAYFTDIEYTLAALIIFVTLFIALVTWAYRKSGRTLYEKMGEWPLVEDQKYERQ